MSIEFLIIYLSNIFFCFLLLKVNNLFAVWCIIECISIVAYLLTSFNHQNSIYAAFIYFVFNSIAGVLIL